MADRPPADRAHPRPLALVPLPDQDQLTARLPAPVTSFIGRDPEIAEVTALLRHPDLRLVTLTGPGGIGKTRLALRIMDILRDDYGGEVGFIPLASVRDPDLVLPTVAHALNVPDVTGQSLAARLPAHVGDRRLLLVLDNLEQVLDAVASLVADLLATCPHVTVLSTSRNRLGISGEQVVPLGALSLASARALFVERAKSAKPAFAPTDETIPTIDSICDRLDRLPLAIELAAARVTVLPPAALLGRLAHRLDLLTGGPRDVPDRYRELRKAIAWSHDLLADPEQVLFRRLGVFDGGFTLDAATTVAESGGDVLDGVAALEASSLLTMTPGWRGEPRYFMLETIRDYALERLSASGDEPATRQRFAAWCSALAAAAATAWVTPDEFDILDQLEWDIANIRETLKWYDHVDDRAAMLRLAGWLGPLWATHGHGREGRSWLERASGSLAEVPADVAAMALRALCWLLNQQAVGARALALAEQSLVLARKDGDQRGIIQSLTLCGVAASKMGDLERAVAYQEEALALLDAAGDQLWEEYLRCVALVQLGAYCIHLGAIDDAETWYARAADLNDEVAIAGLGDVARAQGNDAHALLRYREALRRSWDIHDMRTVAYALGGVAGALAALGHHVLAARLFGASEALFETLGMPFAVETFDRQRAFGLPEPWAAESTSFGVAQRLRDALGNRRAALRQTVMDRALIDPAWQAGRALRVQAGFPGAVREEGTGLSWDEVLAEVDALVETMGNDADAAGAPTDTHGLSPRELEVLRLVAEGASNRRIAERLSVSERTVDHHVEHILAKLGLDSRTAAAVWALRNVPGLAGAPP